MQVTGIDTLATQPADIQSDLDKLEEVSGKIVGQMFYGTLLKAMRESSLNNGLCDGGRGEAVFAGQLHGIYAEQAGTAVQGGLKAVLFDKLKPQQERISAARLQG